MSLNELRLVVDEREKKSRIPDLLKAVGINVEVKTLPVGDYIVAPETIVERKTISDLISSIFDGRLFDQCNRLKDNYQFPILLIEGNLDEIEKLTETNGILAQILAAVPELEDEISKIEIHKIIFREYIKNSFCKDDRIWISISCVLSVKSKLSQSEKNV